MARRLSIPLQQISKSKEFQVLLEHPTGLLEDLCPRLLQELPAKHAARAIPLVCCNTGERDVGGLRNGRELLSFLRDEQLGLEAFSMPRGRCCMPVRTTICCLSRSNGGRWRSWNYAFRTARVWQEYLGCISSSPEALNS